MKKIKVWLASIFMLSAFFVTGCGNGNGLDESFTEENENLTEEEKEKVKTDSVKHEKIKFNMGTFNALAIVKDDGSTAQKSAIVARAGENTVDDMIVKIMEDGSMQSFITVPDNVNLSQVNYIARSPVADAKEIYIVFDHQTSWGDNYENPETHEWQWKNYSIGQLLCVKEDGSFIDILEQDDGTYKWLAGSNQDSIDFDNKGNMYYLAYENRGNGSNTNMIYMFNPNTGKSSQLTTAVQGTCYDKMQVTKDGQWIFVKASRWSNNTSTSYLRAIPTAIPDQFVNLFYTSSNNSSWINDWYYDDDTATIYYIQDSNVYSITQKNGTFDKDNRVTLFSNDSSYNGNRTFWSDALFTWDNSNVRTWGGAGNVDYGYHNGERYGNIRDEQDADYENGNDYYFRNPAKEEELQPKEILNYLYAKAYQSLDSSQISWEQWKNDYKNHKYVMRFDVFEKVEGYETLASLTKDKEDLELINAIINNNLEGLIYDLLDTSPSNGGRYTSNKYFNNFYEHNFFADVLYEKITKTDGTIEYNPIADSLFRKTKYGTILKFAYMGLDPYQLFTSSYQNSYTWKKELKEIKTVETSTGTTNKNVVNAKEVLKVLAEYCGKDEIEFSLECFKNDKKYSIFYTDKKNEDAIEFLDNPARLKKFNDYFGDSDIRDDTNGYGKFLKDTCFVKGSDYKTSAYIWRTPTNNIDQTIWWSSVKNLTPSYKKSLYGVYNCNNGNGSTNGLIKIINEEGVKDGSYVSALAEYKIADLIASADGFYFKRALLDSKGEEKGTHQIFYFNAVDSTCTNLFERVAGGDNLEVISFSVGGGYLYYCAASGLSVVNGKINIATKEPTTLNSNRKLAQIMSVQ